MAGHHDVIEILDTGFSKDQILRKPETDPRAEGGMFSRLVGLLQALGPEGQSF